MPGSGDVAGRRDASSCLRYHLLASVLPAEHRALARDDLEQPDSERATRLLRHANASVSADEIDAPQPRSGAGELGHIGDARLSKEQRCFGPRRRLAAA